MKHVDAYRDQNTARTLAREIQRTVTQPWTLMEVCGGQTHAILKHGVDQLLPESVTLLHGPGCPVCVTPAKIIDQAVQLSLNQNIILCSFGDMIRVPGTSTSLSQAKARGADIRIVYSPLDAVKIAAQQPDKDVVFLAIGFETTAPMSAMAARQAKRMALENFSLLVSHVRVPPALEALLSSDGPRIDAFLAAGHVCTVMGLSEYEPIVQKHHIPIVVTGFEPVDILEGVLKCVRQLEAGAAYVMNQYSRAVRAIGNSAAQELMSEVFEKTDQRWRGIGEIPSSGLKLAHAYRAFDAALKYNHSMSPEENPKPSVCISGEVLRGAKKPAACPAFGTECTPEHPLGSTMVSSEGACAAYFRYAGT